jgi:hypothetical protein
VQKAKTSWLAPGLPAPLGHQHRSPGCWFRARNGKSALPIVGTGCGGRPGLLSLRANDEAARRRPRSCENEC